MADPRSRRRRYLPLLRRVATINTLLMLAAVGVTIVVLVPGRESSFRIDVEGIVLLVGVALVVVVNVLLLRRVVRPLERLTALARTVDLTDPRPQPSAARPNSEADELALTFNEMLARLRAERHEATGRVLEAQENERLRIARELHDQVGQELTAVLLLLSRVEARVPEGLRSAVQESQNSVRASLEDVRRIAIELRPEALDDLGLESALAVLCDRFAKRSGLNVSCEVAPELPEISSDAELVIYRVAQEALTNAARHSASTLAELRLGPSDGRIVLTVRDHGRGLGPDHSPGGGIRGMRERAALVRGSIQIQNANPGPGVEVRLDIPSPGVEVRLDVPNEARR